MALTKKIVLWALIGAVCYVLLSYHFVFIGSEVRLLKKSRLTMNYTFFSVQGKSNKTILAIDELREDGIADLLVEVGKMSEEEKERLMAEFEYGEDY